MTVNRATRKSRSILSTKNQRALAALSAATGLVAFVAASRADTYGENGSSTVLNTAGAWTDETTPATDTAPPAANDTAQFDSLDTLAGSQTYTLGGATSWLGLSILNPAGSVNIGNVADSTNTLTLGTGGINMSTATQSLTINDPLLLSANQSFNVAGGQTLTDTGPINLAAGVALTFNGAGTQNYSGAFNDAGATGSLSQQGSGTVILTAASSYTGNTTVNNGVMELNFAAAGAPASNIASAASTLRIGGGTLLVNGTGTAGSQTFASTNLTGAVGFTNVSVAGNATLNMGAVTVDATITVANTPTDFDSGGLIQFNGPATSSDGLNVHPVAATGTVTLTSPRTGTSGILLNATGVVPYGTVGQVDFAAVSGTTVVGGSTVAGFYTALPTSGGQNLNNANNYDVSNSGEIRFSSNSLLGNTLRFNNPTGGLFNISGNNMDQLVVKGGTVIEPSAILVTPNVGANNILIQDQGGPTNQVWGGQGNYVDDTIFQNNTLGDFILNGGLRSHGGGNAGYAQAGPGEVELNGNSASTVSLPINLYGGLTVIGNFAQGAALGTPATPNPLNLNGGNLAADYSGTIDSAAGARPVTLGAAGGSISATAGNTLTIDGAITGAGPLSIGYGNLNTHEENSTTQTITNATTTGSGLVILTGGAANTYTGGTNLNHGFLKMDSASAGTGVITVNNGANLVGNALLTNAATVNSGGQLTPGDPVSYSPLAPTVGTMSFSSLLLNAGSVLNYGFIGTSTSGIIDLSKSLNIAGATGMNVDTSGTSTPFTNSGTYDVFDLSAGASLSGVGNLSVLNGPGGSVTYTFGTAADGSGGTFVTLVVVGTTPESWNIAGGGSWLTAGNWSPALAGGPNGAGAEAAFPVNIPNTATPETGGTVTLDGSITLGSLTFLSPTAAWNLAPGSGGSLTMQNFGSFSATINNSAGNNAISAPLTLASNTNIAVINAANTLTLSGAITGPGTLTLNTGGSGTILLTANNSYGGATTIAGGTVQVGSGGASGSFGTNTAISNAGTLVMDVSTSQTLTVSGNGNLVQSGASALVLANANTANAVTINAGTIQLGTSGSLVSTGNLTMSAGALLDINGGTVTVGGLAGAGGTIDNVNAATAATTVTIGSDNTSNTFAGLIQNTTGTVALTKIGNGTQTLTSINTYSGGTSINAGFIKVTNTGGNDLGSGTITVRTGNGLQLGNGVSLSNAITVSAGAAEFEDVPDANAAATLTGPVTASAGQQFRVGTINTTSTLTLTGVNTGGGAGSNMIITRGNVVFAGNATLTNNDPTVALTIGRQSSTSTLNLTLNNNAAITSDFGVQVSDGSSSSDIGVTVNLNNSSSINAGGPMDLNDAESVANGGAEINSVVTINVNGTSNISTKNFLLTNLASSGGTNIHFNGGTITATANDPTTPLINNTNVYNGQFFPWFSNPSITSTYGGTGPNPIPALFTANIGTGGLTINNGGFHVTVAQQLGDGGGGAADTLTLVGTGTTVLANSNSYGGNTTLTAGTLVIANAGGSATSNGNVVLNGGVLASATAAAVTALQTSNAIPDNGAGMGFITGNVIAGTGPHTIAPGDIGAIGTMNLTGLTTNNFTTLNFDLGTGAGPVITTGDVLTLGSGTISIGSGTQITVGGTPVVGDEYRIINGTIGGVNTANFVLPAPSGGVGFQIVDNGAADPNAIDLLAVVSGPPNLTWNNAGADNLWNTTSSNWNSGATNTTYSDGALVTFNDNNPSSTAANYAVTLNTTVSPGSVTVNNSNGNYVISGTGSIAGTTALSKSGTGKLTLNTVNTYTGGTNVSAGTLVAGVTGALPSGAVSITGGTLQLAPSTGLATITSLVISGTGTFDINNNHVIINYGSPASDPIASIVALLNAGYNGGAWNGPGGITSSAIASNPGYGVGYADAADVGNPAGLASGTIEVKFTLLGDADLNGTVNGIDFGILAANFNKGVSRWDQGDFNYDSIVNGVDFGSLAANFNKGASAASGGATPADFAALDAFAAANGLLADVPEPASLGLLTLGAVGILARRRRRRNA